MPLDFTDVVVRLESARYQLEALERDIRVIQNANPNRIVPGYDDQRQCRTLVFQAGFSLPRQWHVRIAEIIANARTPLEYIVNILADAEGGHSNRTAFPIFMQPEDFQSAIDPRSRHFKVQGVPQLAVLMMARVQPYCGSEYLALDALRQLDDYSKHHLLHATHGGLIQKAWGFGSVPGCLHILEIPGGLVKSGDPLMWFNYSGPPMEAYPELSAEIVFGQATPGASHVPVMPQLVACLNAATGVAGDFLQAFG